MTEAIKEPDDKVEQAARWSLELLLSKKADEKFVERGRKIVKRYRDDRGEAGGFVSSEERKYNILWSNVQTLMPAIYAKKPKASVERRNKDRSPVARTAAMMLERCLQFEIEYYNDLDSAMRLAILDRLLPGRGTVWIR